MSGKGLFNKLGKINSELNAAMRHYDVLCNGATDEQKAVSEKELKKIDRKIKKHGIYIITERKDQVPIGMNLRIDKKQSYVERENFNSPEIKDFLINYRFYKAVIQAD